MHMMARDPLMLVLVNRINIQFRLQLKMNIYNKMQNNAIPNDKCATNALGLQA